MSGGTDSSGPVRNITNQEIEQALDDSRKVKFRVLFAGIGILILLALLLWPSSKTWKTGVEYQFVYTHQFTDEKTSLSGRSFILADRREPFRSIEKGMRGEALTILDSALPVNTFKIIEKTSPELKADGQTIQEKYDYTEVHYNLGRAETQTIVPPLGVTK